VDALDRLFHVLLRRNISAGVLTAAITVALGALARIVLPFDGFPLVTFFPSVLITAFVGGALPAIFAAGLALLYAHFFLMPVTPDFQISWNPRLGGTVALIVCAIQIGCIEVIRAAAQRAEGRRRRADLLLAERDLMFRELQHRVANNMQFIASFLALKGRQLPPGAGGREAMTDASERLLGFAAVHRKLHDAHRSDNGFAALAADVLTDLLQATGTSHVRLEVVAEPLALSLETTTNLILITTEAATNAIKHVFSLGLGSRLTVRLERDGGQRLVLTVADDGPGFGEAPGACEPRQANGQSSLGQSSLGMRIMQSLIQRLGGALERENHGGAVVRVVFPVSQGADAAEAGVERAAAAA